MSIDEFFEGIFSFKKYYRVGPYRGYASAYFPWGVYVWRWYWPFWVTLETHRTKEEAHKWLEEWLEGLKLYE